MHFLRNKFSPIKNYFEMSDKAPTVLEDKRKQYDQILRKEGERVKISIKDILERTDRILEKSENPFVITQLTPMSLKKVWDISRKIWYDFFDNDSIEFELRNFQGSDKPYELNEEGLEILITDIVENLQQYQNGYYKLKFIEGEKFFSIIMENDVKIVDNVQQELEKLVSDFMSNDNAEINKRKTHGMSMIKSFLLQMKIVHNLSFQNRIFCFKLIFKK